LTGYAQRLTVLDGVPDQQEKERFRLIRNYFITSYYY